MNGWLELAENFTESQNTGLWSDRRLEQEDKEQEREKRMMTKNENTAFEYIYDNAGRRSWNISSNCLLIGWLICFNVSIDTIRKILMNENGQY